MRKVLGGKKFNESMHRCWSKIATSRSNSLCSVCSGRSNSYFSGSKILMADTDCNQILEECAPSLGGLALMMKEFTVYFREFLSLAKMYKKSRTSYFSKSSRIR